MLATDLVKVGSSAFFRFDRELGKWIPFRDFSPKSIPFGVRELEKGFDKEPIITFANTDQIYDIRQRKVREMHKEDYILKTSTINYLAVEDDIEKSYNRILGIIKSLTPAHEAFVKMCARFLYEIPETGPNLYICTNTMLGNVLTTIFEGMYTTEHAPTSAFYPIFHFAHITSHSQITTLLERVLASPKPVVIVADYSHDFSKVTNLTFFPDRKDSSIPSHKKNLVAHVSGFITQLINESAA